MKYNIVIVLPTYNEKYNIKNLLNLIFNQKKYLLQVNLSVLVVDGNSPDGTAQVVKNYIKTNTNVHLLSEVKKEGIGMAYLRGFNYAINVLKADIVFEMDADYSHDVSYMPVLYKYITKGYDFVIGSRYIKGASISKDWPVVRLLNSRLCNFFARHIAGLRNIYDCTSGFRTIKVDVLKRINFHNIKAKSYSFQIVLLYLAWKEGFKILEIPINFHNRKKGTSKMAIRDTIEFMFHAASLRLFGSI